MPVDVSDSFRLATALPDTGRPEPALPAVFSREDMAESPRPIGLLSAEKREQRRNERRLPFGIVGSLAVLFLWPKVSRRIPAPIVAILAGTAAAAWLGLPVETIGSRFGTFHAALPAMSLPALSLDQAALTEPHHRAAQRVAVDHKIIGNVCARHRQFDRHASRRLASFPQRKSCSVSRRPTRN